MQRHLAALLLATAFALPSLRAVADITPPPGILPGSSAAFSAVTIDPTPSSLVSGLKITQTLAGASALANTYANTLRISSDNADVGTRNLWGFGVDYTCCSSSAKGQRFAIGALMSITGASSAADALPSYVAVEGVANVSTPAPNSSAGVWAGNFNAALTGAATGWAQISAAELDVTVLAGANPLTKIALPIVLGTNDAVHGSAPGGDAAISFYSTTTSTAGWNALLMIDQQAGHGKTIATAGCVICTVGTITMGDGIDLSGTTVTGNFLKGPSGFSVGGNGYLTLPRNQSIQFNDAGTIRNLARWLNASDTITFGDTDNGGIAPALWNFAGGKVSISDATASTTTATGALVVTGGLGVGGALNVGGTAGVAGLLTVGSAAGGSITATGDATFQRTAGNSETVTIATNGAAALSVLKFSNTGASGRTYSLNMAGNTAGNANTFYINDDTNAAVRLMVGATGGIELGAPTGGDKGAGTLNPAGAVYDNGTAPTGTAGSGYARATSPVFVTPTLGAATATTINKVTLTQPASGSTLTIANGKTLTASNSLTLAGTDATTMTFPTTSKTLMASDYSNATAKATAQSQVAAPTGTANTTGVMMGLAGTITPTVLGKIFLVVSGDIFNATAITDGGKVQASYGTGTAPANGAAISGTQCGGRPIYIAATTAGKAPFSVQCVATGLTVGTAYWLDVTLAAVTGGTATIENVSVSAHEL